MEHKQTEQQNYFLEFAKDTEGFHFVVGHFIEATVVYNRPDSLEKIICMVADNQYGKHQKFDKRTLFRISNLTRILNRDKCKSIFCKIHSFERTKPFG